MKILFITRKYPPQIGGMEAFSFGLINNIKCDKEIIALNKKQIHLLWWLPYALILTLFKARRVEHIHLGDGLLAPIGFLIKKIYRKPVSVTVHGLDITYNNFIYQNINVRALKHLDKIICVSSSTKQDCIEKGVSESIIEIIPNGIDINKFSIFNFQFSSSQNKILLTVGRLVKRKGVEWFIKEVMPKLDQNIIYLIAGDGPEMQNIHHQIINLNLEHRVKLLGRISHEKLIELYNTADLFIMPNIHVKGDTEGFGIVALEAGACGLMTLATDIDGIRDVIKDNENGYLLPDRDALMWANKVNEIIKSDYERIKICSYIHRNYSWREITNQYKKIWESKKH
ncbi:MAG: glycosyltransferase family 4 protein [Patescibacteria group bacterium]